MSRTKCWQGTCANTELSGKEANRPRRVKTELLCREENAQRQAPSSNCLEPRKLMRCESSKERSEVIKDEARMKRRLETELKKPITK